MTTFRITNLTQDSRLMNQISLQRQRIAQAQERVTTGSRINRPSDDPTGAGTVVRLRTSQQELSQLSRNAQAAGDRLSVSDTLLDSYELLLGRVKSLVTQGVSDTTTQEGRNAIAIELEGLKESVLKLANRQNPDGAYFFGGTRQTVPPFDPVTATPAGTPTSPPLIQIEPQANPIQAGVTAESVFINGPDTVFSTVDELVTALRGTGNPVADKSTLQTGLGKVTTFARQAISARTVIGKGLNSVETAQGYLDQYSFSLDETLTQVAGADFAESALQLTQANQALEATLQSGASIGRKSLLDFLG